MKTVPQNSPYLSISNPHITCKYTHNAALSLFTITLFECPVCRLQWNTNVFLLLCLYTAYVWSHMWSSIFTTPQGRIKMHNFHIATYQCVQTFCLCHLKVLTKLRGGVLQVHWQNPNHFVWVAFCISKVDKV
jgi:hypothetical protein